MMMRIILLLTFFLGFIPVSQSPAQERFTVGSEAQSQAEFSQSTGDSEGPPRQFRALSLGMALDDLKSALIKDGLFLFRGDRDVSFIPIREETLVETTGLSYIRRAYFQLSGGAVFIMSFSLDTQIMDHYSVFTTFVKKYGQPLSLSPSEAVWESDDTRVSIERPLTVKYIDKTVFDRLIEESKTREKWELLLREEFLSDF